MGTREASEPHRVARGLAARHGRRRHIRPDRSREDRRRHRACGAAAGAGRGSGGDLLRCAAGVRGAVGAHRGRHAPRSRPPGAQAGRVRAGHRAVLGRGLHAAWRTRRSMRRWRRGGGRSWWGGRGSICGPRLAELSLVKAPPEAEDSELWSPRDAASDRRSSGSTWSGRSSTSGSMRGPRRSSRRGRGRRSSGPRRRGRRAPRARRSASTRCSAATSSGCSSARATTPAAS